MKHWSHTHPELHRLYHILWTKSVGTPDYDKAEWKLLGDLLDQLVREPPKLG